MENIEKIVGALASALHIDARELTAALKDGDQWLADSDLAAELSSKVAAQVSAAKKEQHARGLREGWTKVERWVKTQGFEPEDKVTGEALLSAFSEHLKAQTTIEPGKDRPTKADLLKMPEVRELLAENGQKYEAVKAEYEGYKKQVERKSVEAKAKEAIVKYLDEARVILDVEGSTSAREKRIDAVAKYIAFDQVALSANGTPIFVDADGNELLDENGNRVDFKKSVIATGESLFGIMKQDPAKSGGSPKPGASGTEPRKIQYTFSSQSDFDAQVSTEPDAAKRAAMMQDYLQSQQAAGQ